MLNVLLVTLSIVSIAMLPKAAVAVCSTEERWDMATRGMQEWEINAECAARGPIMGSVCSTLHTKCRLPAGYAFGSSCWCGSDPGYVQQY
jgi:hypothetical protein